MENLDVDVRFKKKFVNEVLLLYKKMSNGYYPDITFLQYESSLLNLLDNYPELEDSFKYIINYYLTHTWQDKI